VSLSQSDKIAILFLQPLCYTIEDRFDLKYPFVRLYHIPHPHPEPCLSLAQSPIRSGCGMLWHEARRRLPLGDGDMWVVQRWPVRDGPERGETKARKQESVRIRETESYGPRSWTRHETTRTNYLSERRKVTQRTRWPLKWVWLQGRGEAKAKKRILFLGKKSTRRMEQNIARRLIRFRGGK